MYSHPSYKKNIVWLLQVNTQNEENLWSYFWKADPTILQDNWICPAYFI